LSKPSRSPPGCYLASGSARQDGRHATGTHETAPAFARETHHVETRGASQRARSRATLPRRFVRCSGAGTALTPFKHRRQAGRAALPTAVEIADVQHGVFLEARRPWHTRAPNCGASRPGGWHLRLFRARRGRRPAARLFGFDLRCLHAIVPYASMDADVGTTRTLMSDMAKLNP
jgi:hypothetical protein